MTEPTIPRSLTERLTILAAVLAAALCAPPLAAQETPRLDQVLDAIVAGEQAMAASLEQYSPLVETYLQTVKPDPVLGQVPVRDHYFFGRLELPNDTTVEDEEAGEEARKKNKKDKKSDKTLSLFDEFYSQTFKPEAFSRMLIIDRGAFDRDHYDFEFLRTEFLGEIRTLVFDVTPRKGKALNRMRTERFTGRIWVEDQGYRIVRYNGIYASPLTVNFHFDSWRLNMAPDQWLPAYVYTEEPDRTRKNERLTHKGQTRIWGYKIQRRDAEAEFTQVLIEAPQTKDELDEPGQVSPVASARAWEAEAENNVVKRLERAGLLAPAGEVDAILDTVVANLEITNGLQIQPPVQCRVLLTTPLESFTIGHTIVLSRGLIDVLPDEASLAMVLAHELGHVLSGHELDTRYAFSDQMLVGDREALQGFLFERDPLEEVEADRRAVELLASSPYKDGLQGAGLFLKALAAGAEDLSALIRPHFGNRLAQRDQLYRMPSITEAAPMLDPTSVEQIAALPLGGRVKLDPWSAQIELMTNNRVPLLSAREKMPFQITPLMPYLARYESGGLAPIAGPDAEPHAAADAGAGTGSGSGSGQAVAADATRSKR